ncbi:DUF4157 domain-containing protein [Chloroflexota bacterium]
MAERETMNRKKKKKLEAEITHKRKAKPAYDQSKAADQGALDLKGKPSVNRHAAILAQVHSNEQRANLIIQLQQSYGNAYVQQVMGRIQSEKGSGKRLEPETRSEMERAFKQDFSDVRIHADATADKLPEELGAKAFTSGKDIFFQKGIYQPGSEAGKSLLGHELTHVVQQESGSEASQSSIGRAGDTLEQEATWVGRAVSDGYPASVEKASAVPALQCQSTETEETAAADTKEKGKADLTEAVEDIAGGKLEQEYIKILLRSVQACQMLGLSEDTWQWAWDEAARVAIDALKTRIPALEVDSSDPRILEGLLKAAEDVQELGGEEEVVETAWTEAFDLARDQLASAKDLLSRIPSKAAAETVTMKLLNLMLLGGADAPEAIAALDLLSTWREGSGWAA